MKYYGTKIEIVLKKAEPGAWLKLALPQAPVKLPEQQETLENKDIASSDDDLDEIEMTNTKAYLKTI